MNSDWNMPRRAEACAGCGRAFAIGQPLRALLYASENGYTRLDYCEACELPPQPVPIGSWRTRRREPAAPKAVPFDREAIFGFFQRLAETDSPEKVQFRFVLALLLWRKRVLNLERTDRRGTTETWSFLAGRTGERYAVERPELDEEQLERLGTQLEQVLAGAEPELEVVPEARDEEAKP